LIIYKKNKNISEQLSNVQDAPQRIVLLEKRNVEMDKVIGKSINLESDLHKQLLEKVSGYCEHNHITLREFKELHLVKQQDYTIETSSFIVEGIYVKILRLVKLLETEYKIGKIVSVKFYSEKNPKTNKISLKAHIYVQNIKKQVNRDEKI